MAGIDRQLRILPPSLRQSITFDPGTEFAAFLILREKLGMASYFCMPSAPWQKGSVENNNGRIRRRSEEHTSELQSLMRISYAVFCLKKKNTLHKQRTLPA